MTPALKVDADAMRSMSALLRERADAIAKIDPSPSIRKAAATMKGTAIGPAVDSACDPVKQAYEKLADQVRSMSESAKLNAENYEEADKAFADQLNRYQAGD